MSHNISVDKAELNKFSKLANEWWDVNGPLKTLHDINQVRSDYVNNFKTVAGLELLDVGCGGGIFAEAMAKRQALVTGIDPEVNAINVAKEHADLSKLNINYRCCAIEDFATNKFAIITCLEMLEHVENPELIIANAKRLLNAGGYLFLSTINRTLKAYAQVIVGAEYLLNILPRQTHDFAKFIKPSELCALLREYEFELIDISGMGYNPITRKAYLNDSIDVNYLVACRLSI